MRVKRSTFSGDVCEQEIYCVSERARSPSSKPKLRFQSEEERQQHRLGISRRKHARLVNENFDEKSLYSTLTFSDDYEVHTFSEARRIRDNFFRRLRYHCPNAKIAIYMGRGKSTHRIHFHMLSAGLPESIIIQQWLYGTVLRIVSLRKQTKIDGVTVGRDYTGLANYLHDHWTPEQGGHRWKMTKNMRQPMREEPKEIKRSYSEDKPPLPPKGYKLVECKITRYGYMWFKYVKEASRLNC